MSKNKIEQTEPIEPIELKLDFSHNFFYYYSKHILNIFENQKRRFKVKNTYSAYVQ